jgi:hypothetical protein
VLEEYESQFKIPSVESYFCDELANLYKPVIYGGDYSDLFPEGITIESCMIVL